MTDREPTTPARRDGSVVEPELLPSLEEAERTSGRRPGAAGPFDPRFPFGAHGAPDPRSAARPPGCTLGPGCGCIGLPLALVAGMVISALVALLWLLSLGRVPVSIVQMARHLRRGRRA